MPTSGCRAHGARSAHLNAVMNSPELREVYNANLPQDHPVLHRAVAGRAPVRQVQGDPRRGRIRSARAPSSRKIVDNELRDFRLGGAELPPEQKARFKAVRERLDELSSRFNDNVLDATNAFAICVTDEAELAGIPDDVLEAARSGGRRRTASEGWKFTLHMPSYLPVMQYADNRALRELMYRAYVTRAAEFGNAEWDNTPLIDEILELRARGGAAARLRQLRRVVARRRRWRNRRQQVLAFLDDLAARAKPFAQRDFDELAAFRARASSGSTELEAWDVGWASEKLRVERYAFSEQEVKQYFPEHQVLPGMFRAGGNALRHPHRARPSADLASRRALLRHPQRAAAS